MWIVYKIQKCKISVTWSKTLVLSTYNVKGGNNNNIFKEEHSIEILKPLSSIDNINE